MYSYNDLNKQLLEAINDAKVASDDKIGRAARKRIAFLTDCIRMLQAFDGPSLSEMRDRQALWYEANKNEFTEKQKRNYAYQDSVLSFIIEGQEVSNG